MSLLLTLEHGPRAQAMREARLDKGDMVIGRSPEADWQIEDPDMFVSRAHCKITASHDGYYVTDTSSSGLFIDDAGSPLGAGNTMRLQNGMRLRIGDYVVGVDLHSAVSAGQASPSQPSSGSHASVNLGSDDFFALKTEEEPQRRRPAELPNPFEQPEPGAFRAYERETSGRSSPAFDDPFSLDPVSTPATPETEKGGETGTSAFGDPFGLETPPPPEPPPARQARRQEVRVEDVVVPSANRRFEAPSEQQRGAHPSPAPWDRPVPRNDAPPPPKAEPKPARRTAEPGDVSLRAAFLRGMGLDESEIPARDAIAEMEKLGREYRLMMEGLMQLLRKRAEEKGNARIEQTVVGASEVNPLKFLPTVDDALATILAERSPGFLSGEPAIQDAVWDLAHHHVRAWRGLQGALRRMIDRFDPAALEEELKQSSSLETLLAGGRGAKLWELYKKRHREIAISAETRFMGEIGADFRNAYEEE
ncbi:MAG: type VI secretion protein [Mesorhizobium sp. SCN 65-20]|nr:MAG: type VI secretion protein [Mesorhizobium sp. SCN 65-20]